MPQATSVSGEDYASNDEVKVYKDEGENEDEKRSENLNEEKLGLVTETEEGKNSDLESQDEKSSAYVNGVKLPDLILKDHFPFSYPLLHPHPPLSPLVTANKLFPSPGLGFLMCGGAAESLSSPPPAHMGVPPLHLDFKAGLPRSSFYGLPAPIPPPSHIYSPSVVSNGEFYLSSQSGTLRSPYSSPNLPTSPFSWLSNPALFPYNFPNSTHHLSTSLHASDELSPLSESLELSRNTAQTTSQPCNPSFQLKHQYQRPHKLFNNATPPTDQKRSYVKKPLNAFMLFMKEMRQKVIEECTLKESAAINQILGKKWHALERSEQAKYYEMAKKEKESHMQQHPGWSARDNYATHTKKKKKRETVEIDSHSNKKPRLQCMEASSTISDSSPRPPGVAANGNQQKLNELHTSIE